jgi:hypothetical protein
MKQQTDIISLKLHPTLYLFLLFSLVDLSSIVLSDLISASASASASVSNSSLILLKAFTTSFESPLKSIHFY